MIRYNTNLSSFEVYQASNWATVATGAGAGDNLGNHTATTQILSTLGTASAPGYAFNGDADTGIWNVGAGQVAISTNATERVRIDSSGNMGIGSASPQYRVDVAGSIAGGDIGFRARNNNSSGYTVFTLFNDSASHSSSIFMNGTSQSAYGGIESLNIYNFVTNAPMTFGTDNVERIRISGAGRVGIGSTNPTTGAILDINGTGVNFSSVVLPRATTALRPTAAVNGMIRYNTNLSAFEVYQASNWATVATGAGAGDNLGNHTATTQILSTLGTASAPGYSFVGDADTGIWNVGAGQVAISTNSTERMRIDSNGNIGVGTTTPVNVAGTDAKVTVGDGTGQQYLVIRGANSGTTLGGSASNSAGIELHNTNATAGNFSHFGFRDASGGMIAKLVGVSVNQGSDQGDLAFLTGVGGGNVSEVARVRYNGRVGIGTTNPGTGLEIAGTGANSAILIPRETTANRPTAAINGMIRYNVNLSAFEVYQASNWATLATGSGASFPLLANPIGSASAAAYSFNGDGNTGMYSPGADTVALAVRGTERMRIDAIGTVTITGPATSTTQDLIVSSSDYSGISIVSTGGSGRDFRLVSTTLGTFGVWDFSAGGAERMTMDASGNLGLGTTGPSNRLDVRDTQAANAVAYVYNTNTGAAAEGMRVQIDATTPGTSNSFASFLKSGGTVIGSITGDGAGGVQYNLASDRRLKGNIRDTHYTIADLMKIRVRDYHYLGHNVDTNGFIAQELYEAYAPAVSKPVDESVSYWQVDYGRLTPLIVKSVQDVYGMCEMTSAQQSELAARVAAHDREISSLKREVQSLREKNIELEQKLNRVLERLEQK